MNRHWKCTCNVWVWGILVMTAIGLYHQGYVPIPSDDHSKNDTAPTNSTTPTNYSKPNQYDDITEMIIQENEESNLIFSASNPTISRAVNRSTENPSFVNDILLWTR